MKVDILTPLLKVEAIDDQNWRLLEPLTFRVTCDEWSEPFEVVVPGGYVTDFESVPRLLVFAYVLIKGHARRAATGHDYLIDWIQNEVAEPLRPATVPFRPTRAWVDSFFHAAMLAEGTGFLARNTAYLGVSAYTLFTGGQ